MNMYMKINTKKGFAPLVPILIIAILSLGGTTIYLIQKNKPSIESIVQEKKQEESNDFEISTTTLDTDFMSELEQLKKELDDEREKRKELERKVVQHLVGHCRPLQSEPGNRCHGISADPPEGPEIHRQALREELANGETGE